MSSATSTQSPFASCSTTSSTAPTSSHSTLSTDASASLRLAESRLKLARAMHDMAMRYGGEAAASAAGSELIMAQAELDRAQGAFSGQMSSRRE